MRPLALAGSRLPPKTMGGSTPISRAIAAILWVGRARRLSAFTAWPALEPQRWPMSQLLAILLQIPPRRLEPARRINPAAQNDRVVFERRAGGAGVADVHLRAVLAQLLP